MFPLQRLPLPGEILLITDELSSPADFLLHRNLAAHLKSGRDAKCAILSVPEDVARWKAIAGRSNINLGQSIASRSLSFLDIISVLWPNNNVHQIIEAPLKAVLDKLRGVIDEWRAVTDARILVILDDISTLEWANASLIIRHHVVTPGELDDLLRHLLQLCTYHVDVFPLSSGKSGSVSGQVALHAGPAAANAPFKLIQRSAAVHYRLTDTGSLFFDRGTGEAVL